MPRSFKRTTGQGHFPYESALSYWIPIRLACLERNPEDYEIGYKETINWYFSHANANDSSQRLILNFKNQYRKCYLAVPDTVEDFKAHLLKNNYLSQAYLLTKKIVQRSVLDPAGIDNRAAAILCEHIDRAGTEKPVGDSIIKRVRFNFRTVLIDALFPYQKLTGVRAAKVITPVFPIALYFSVLHTSCILGIGMFQRETSADMEGRRKRRKRDSQGYAVNSSNAPSVDIVDEKGELSIPQFSYDTSPTSEFFRLRKVPSGKCTAKTLSCIISRLIEAWDSFANLLGFRSVDVMIAPYITLNFEILRYEVVPDNTLAPLAQLHEQTEKSIEPVDPNPKDCAEFAYLFYTKRDAFGTMKSQKLNPDKYLRDIAKVFVTQVYKYGLDSKYFINLPVVEEIIKEFEEEFAHTHSHHGVPNGIYDHVDMDLLSKFSNLHNMLLTDQSISATSYLASQSDTARHRRFEELPDDILDASVTVPYSQGRGSAYSEQSGTPQISSCPPLCECNEARHRIANYIRQYSRIYRCDFDDLTDTDSLEGGPTAGPLNQSVQLVLTDPPNNIRRNNRSNSNNDSISHQDMEHCVQTITEILQPGGHVIIFCRILNFPKWHKLFKVLHDTSDDPVYAVDDSPICCIPVPGHDGGQGSRTHLGLRNVCEYALHAYRKPKKVEGDSACALSHVSYRPQGHIFSTHPGYTNVMDNIPRLSPGEQIIYVPSHGFLPDYKCDEEDVPVSGTPLRAEQKNVRLLRELISRFSSPGDIVVDLFAGTFSTAVAALTLPQHRVFVGCDVSDICVKMGNQRLIDVFATLVHSEARHTSHSDISVDAEMAEVVAVHHVHITERRETELTTAARDRERWSPPSGLPLAQILPKQVAAAAAISIHSTCDPHTLLPRSSVDVLQQICTTVELKPPSDWPASLYLAFSEIDISMLRMADALSCHVNVSVGADCRPGKMVVRVSKPFPKGSIIGFLNGTIVYRNLQTELYDAKTKHYGSGFYAITPKDFEQRAFCILRRTRNKIKSAPGDIYLVPAPFCSLQYAIVRDSEVPVTNAVVNNTLRNTSPSTHAPLTVPSVLTVFAACDISRFEILQIDCSSLSI